MGHRLAPAAAFRVLESMTEGVSVSDENGFIIYTNPAEDAMFGYARGELVGRPVTVLNAYPQEENERIVAAINRELKEHGAWVGEWRNRRKQGDPFTTKARITAIEMDGSQYWVCVQEDITACRQAEERLRALVEHASDGILVADREGAYREVNPAGCAMLGYARDELLSMNATQVVVPAEHQRLENLRRELIETGRTDLGEWRLRRKDGSILHTEINTSMLADGRWQACVRDLTGRRRTEEDLRKTNRTLETLIEASPLPIVTIAVSGEVTRWNPAAERLFGWQASEVIGRPIPFIPEHKRAEHRALREQDLRGESLTGRIVHRQRRDGSPLVLSVSTSPLRDEDGQITGILSLYADVTAQVQAESARIESERRFQNAADTAPVMIWMSGADKLCTWLNRPWLEFTGKTLEQGMGNGWMDDVHPFDRIRRQRIMDEHFARHDSFQAEFRLRRHDNVYHWILDSGIPRFSPGGEFLGYIGSCIDINDRKQAEQDRERAIDALARTNQELKQFAYVASHDLQEPLRTIGVYTQLLNRKFSSVVDDECREFSHYVIDSARRLSELIQGLLAFSHLSDSAISNVQVFSSAECVRLAIRRLQSQIENARAIIHVDELPEIRGNAAQVTDLFQNLISNAIQYRRGEGVEIRITAAQHDGDWVFAVADNGIGIAPEYHHRIFGLFKRLHGGELPGTGLGLAISKKIVENHQGRIWVQSSLGEGATFFFQLGL